MPFDGGAAHRIKPVGPWRLDRGHGLARGLAFLVPLLEGGGSAFDLVTGTAVALNTGGAWTRKVGGVGVQGDGTNASMASPSVANTAALLPTSDGAGAGDFTLAMVHAIAAGATRAYSLNHGNVADAFRRAALIVNGTDQNTNSSGNWCLNTISTTGNNSNLATSGGTHVNGGLHIIGARRFAAAAEADLWQDGAQIVGRTAYTNRDINAAGSNQRLALGARGDTLTTLPLASGQPVFLLAGWNRALDDTELRCLPFTIWQLLHPMAGWGAPGFKAAGGSTTPQAIAASATGAAVMNKSVGKPLTTMGTAIAGAVRVTLVGLAAVATTMVALLRVLVPGAAIRPARATVGDDAAIVAATVDRAATMATARDVAAVTVTLADTAAG